jgi:hypothetical protein
MRRKEMSRLELLNAAMRYANEQLHYNACLSDKRFKDLKQSYNSDNERIKILAIWLLYDARAEIDWRNTDKNT